MNTIWIPFSIPVRLLNSASLPIPAPVSFSVSFPFPVAEASSTPSGGVVGRYRSPEFAAVLGLILHRLDDQNKIGKVSSSGKENSGLVVSKIKNFIKELF